MASSKHDLVIVGGGPAGISTALHVLSQSPALAERTVVLERASYPREKYCAGAVGRRALAVLDGIGVSLSPEDVPRVPLNAFSFATGDARWVVREPNLGWVVRRTEFDRGLALAARRRGLQVVEEARVTAVEGVRGGVRVHVEGRGVLEARAVVGADGVAGVVRASAGFGRGHARAQAVEVDTDTAPGDPPRDALHFDFGRADLHGYAWDFPTRVDGHDRVCRGVYRVTRPAERDDVRARLERFLADKGLALADYRIKQYAEQGFEPGEPISRPHVLLVGEAAGIDIATGEGIAQAVQYGQVAGAYLARAFRAGDLSFHDWLARVHAADVGRQLRARLWAYGRFFGVDRGSMERVIARAPSALRLAMRSFAGAPIGRGLWLRALADLAPALAAEGAGVFTRTAESVWSAARARGGVESDARFR